VVQFILDEAHLLNICVDPDLQGRGFGRRILEHVIEHAKSRDSAIVVLEVRRSNNKAQNLYLQMGFNEMSVRRGYYPAQQGREDAILMGLDLDMMAIFSSQ
jgi:ribosomal-protein-alanine N-acetyltransferase